MSKQEGPAIPAPSMCEPVGEFEVVTKEIWNEVHKALLEEEKALMKVRDRLIAKRRRLPVTEVDRGYRFIGPEGETDLLGLFQGRRQLIVYRFFYAPDVENWPDGACSGCSMLADTIVHPAHVAARDTTLAFVTAAPMDHIERLRERMGWGHIPFYSLPDDRFSIDFDERLHQTRWASVSDLFPQWSRYRGHRFDFLIARSNTSEPPGRVARRSAGSAARRTVHLVAAS